MSPSDVVIVSACRTPVGSFQGAYNTVSAKTLGAAVIRESLQRCSVDTADVSEVIMGQVFTAGQGQNPVRQAAMEAGLPKEVPAYGINMLCGSGLKSVVLGVQAIQCGDATIVVAGGMENMSQTVHCLSLRTGTRLGNCTLVDTMLKDGLTDAFKDCHMGITAENVAERFGVTRSEQDFFALASQKKASEAQTKGQFEAEIVPVTVTTRSGSRTVCLDEFIRKEATIESLQKLRPAFKNEAGTVTAGNASGLNDGAAAVVLMTRAHAHERGLTPLCRVVSHAQVGLDPAVMGCGPIFAVRKALEKAKWNINDVGLFELNEAFAAQSIVVTSELGCDSAKVNVRGGSIAIGHPLGASGARVLCTLIYALRHENKRRGVAALCVGGGMGISMCVEMSEVITNKTERTIGSDRR